MNGLTYPLTLPAMLLGVLHLPKNRAVGWMKKLLPSFDYHCSIYMTKWIVFWNCLFGWNIIGMLSARDRDERREHLMRCAVVDTFFFFGDDIFAGIAGKVMQGRRKNKAILGNIKLYTTKLGIRPQPG